MFKRLVITVLCFVALSSSAQYATPIVLGSAGGWKTTATYELSWTLGEGVIMTMESSSSILTCGFHQSNQVCTGDLDFDGDVDIVDLLMFLSDFGCQGVCVGDFNFDSQVNTSDLLIFLGVFGNSCY